MCPRCYSENVRIRYETGHDLGRTSDTEEYGIGTCGACGLVFDPERDWRPEFDEDAAEAADLSWLAAEQKRKAAREPEGKRRLAAA